MVQIGDRIVKSVDWRLPSVGERIEVTIQILLHMSEVEAVYLYLLRAWCECQLLSQQGEKHSEDGPSNAQDARESHTKRRSSRLNNNKLSASSSSTPFNLSLASSASSPPEPAQHENHSAVIPPSLIDDEKHRLPHHAIFHKSTVTACHENQSLNHGAIVCIGDLIRCSQICKYFQERSIYACRNDPYG